jgi:hypothetical protein
MAGERRTSISANRLKRARCPLTASLTLDGQRAVRRQQAQLLQFLHRRQQVALDAFGEQVQGLALDARCQARRALALQPARQLVRDSRATR